MRVPGMPANDGQAAAGPAPGHLGRRQFLIAGGAAAALAGGSPARSLFGAPVTRAGPAAPRARAAAGPAATGSWTAPFALTLVSIHAVVLHTGNVLLFSWPNKTVGSDAVLWNPVSGTITNIALSYQRDIFCGGTTVMSDGRVFIAGGHIYQGAINDTQGVANTTVFDPASSSWTEGPIMSEARWYPTTMLLGDGTVIICAGTVNSGANATTTGLLAWTNLATTWFLNPATATWAKGPKLNSAGRGVTDTSVLLPGLTKIMEIGGSTASGPTATCEILDTSAATLAWTPTGSMNFARVWANTVLLADGTVLVVGGGQSGSYGSPIFTSEIYDPATGVWTEMAAQTAPRIYHSTAVLLPDGRVLSAGESHGSLAQTGEIFSPPYLFQGARPTISSAPGTLSYGQGFTVSTPDAASISRVALVKAGSVTHSNNFDQRYVDCTFTAGSGSLSATAPPDSNHAPPGWYMLFLVNSGGVPSVASWVQVS
jgi:hypothetical protein